MVNSWGAPCCPVSRSDWHVNSPLRCHVPVAGHALLAVADADGLIGLYQLLGSKVSGWGRASSGGRERDGDGLGGSIFGGSSQPGSLARSGLRQRTATLKERVLPLTPRGGRLRVTAEGLEPRLLAYCRWV